MNSRFNTAAATVIGALATWLGSSGSRSTGIGAGRSEAVPVGDAGHIVVGFWAGTCFDEAAQPSWAVPFSRPGRTPHRRNRTQQVDVFVTSVPFRPCSHEIEPHLLWELHHLARSISRFSILDVNLSGHTDSRGPRDKNRELSERRVTTVRDILIHSGVESQRILSRAHGRLRARYSPDDTQGHAFDGRVLVRVTEGGANHV